MGRADEADGCLVQTGDTAPDRPTHPLRIDVRFAKDAAEERRLHVTPALGAHGGGPALTTSRPCRLRRTAGPSLELADDARCCGVLADLRAARERLADADRRVLVSRKRCRLLRAALALAPDA